MRAILKAWITNHPKPVLLVPLPIYYYVEALNNPIRYQTRFKELAAETGCILHDPLPDMQQYTIKERRNFRFKQDVHWTPQGHTVVAQSLAPITRRIFEN